jgi:glycine hydroxymethyltransferase
MDLAAGGHLTHGGKANQSGKWFNAVHYGVTRDDHLIDFDDVAEKAERHRPKVIIAGGSAYSRIIDFRRFRKVADSVGAALMVDMAHFAGLVAAGLYPNPLDHAHVVTSTTHKTLRGPRGGLVLTNDPELAKKIRSALFPGIQGGPLMHVIAAKAVAFGEALQPAFKAYAKRVVENAQALASTLVDAGYAVVSGGTDTHLALIDLRPKGVKGNAAEQSLERAGVTCNKNGVPFDPEKPTITSGIRIGSPACTTRGFGAAEFREVGSLMAEVLDGLAQGGDNSAREQSALKRVRALAERFPIYGWQG